MPEKTDEDDDDDEDEKDSETPTIFVDCTDTTPLLSPSH
jgi:hypothetical protein